MSVNAHYNAIAAMLPSDITVYRGKADSKPEYPYVVLWGDQGVVDTETLSEATMDLALKVNVTVAGETEASVLIVNDRVRAALNRKQPLVSGWAPSMLICKYSQGVGLDEAVTLPGTGHPMFCVDRYELQSTPLPQPQGV